MNTKKQTKKTDTPAEEDAYCNIDIQIKSEGDVNIYNCAAPKLRDESCQSPKDDHICPPVAAGACVPVSLGSKPKQSRRQKLDNLLANVKVPSTLGASFFQMTRRYLAGKKPANTLEERIFAKFHALPPNLHRLLACTLDSFDTLTSSERNRLFASDLLGDIDQPIEIAQLAQAFIQEILENAGISVFNDPRCVTEEHPGQIRTQPNPGGEFPPIQVRICRINGLRTGQFLPRLAAGDYTLDELQQKCRMVSDGTGVRQVCEVQTTDCPPGTNFDGVCLRLHLIEAGQAAVLEGVNFSSLDTKVQLTARDTGNVVAQVDAHVCGDEETPLTEIVNGVEVPITDCRVHDRLTFRVPDNLNPGQYDIAVLVPNEGHVPGWPDILNSDPVEILITLPSTARYEIFSETLHCKDETSPGWIGSDEVGIKILSTPLFPDLTMGDIQEPNDGKPIRFGNVDSGDQRGMDHLLFSHQQPIAGMIMSIKGYEIDSETAFEEEITGFWANYYEFIKICIEEMRDAINNSPDRDKFDVINKAISYTLAIIFGIIVGPFFALWAPADPIMDDAIGLSALDLLQLTDVNFPLPLPSDYITPNGIQVKVTPLEKNNQQYRERREYITYTPGQQKESDYEIVLRYNRVA